jgi:hypothetical protein
MSGPGRVLVTTVYQGPNCQLYINGNELAAYAPGMTARLIEVSDAGSGVISVDHPDAAAACQDWIGKRQAKFARPERHRGDRRIKTLQEQAHDLQDALLSLIYVTNGVREGKLYLRGHLASALRALVYWQNDDRPDANYNPLLFRLASRADLPLPVFAIGESDGDMPDIIRAADLHLTGNFPEIVHTAPAQHLVDLQDWLLMPALIDRSSGTCRTIDYRSLIAEFANTLGSSHYGEEASELLDIAETMGTGYMSALVTRLVQSACAVSFLGEWVLQELRNRNLMQ